METNFLQIQQEYKDSMPDYILFLMNARNQFKFFHWQTHSFSEHESFDNFVNILDDFLDKFVEAYQGKYERLKVLGDGNSGQFISNYESVDGLAYLKALYEVLNVKMVSCLSDQDSDLLNLIDEIVLNLNKLLFLLTLE
jgi:hypothetical protein